MFKAARSSYHVSCALCLAVLLGLATVYAEPRVTSPKEQLGFNIGDDYHLATYTQLMEYWQKLEKESPRMRLVEMGRTAEGRPQLMAVITSPQNHRKLDRYKEIARRLALAEGLSDAEAQKLAQEGRAVVWIDGGLHATEVVGAHQLMEMVYQMVSRSDPETLRFLDDVIILAAHANPDGMELVSSWYMREADPQKRSTENIPRLYQKYVGHDNNRDSYMVNQPETENMNRIMYREWYPQIMYNHHQTGPSDLIVFVPPFRDPPNYHFDPLLITGIESVGAAMHNRMAAEGKPGAGMRRAASYSTWFNGNVRTTGYFHNQIGLLTEMKGNPTPLKLAYFPDRQLKSMDVPFPHEPTEWHFRQAIDYSITLNRAVVDYASRYRETVLYNRYLMGKNSIERGSRDHWTIHPKMVDAVNEQAKKDPDLADELAQTFRRRGGGLPDEYYDMLHKPENRDPRGYILPADQADLPTATKFVNTFIKNGVTVHRATREFEVGGKTYPAGSYVFMANQAFRPHIMDMFEPQDHPNDFLYEGGPPIPPYDNAGYTLAFQMGVEFDRVLEGFDGPFERIEGLAKPLPGTVTGAQGATGFLLSHAVNDAFIATNRLLAQGHQVYWMSQPVTVNGRTLPAGTIYIEAQAPTTSMLETMARELGLSFEGVPDTPEGGALRLRPVRIGLWDQYGGSMPSGWTRWLFEQFEFPFEVVYPQELDAGNLKSRYDVLVLPTEAIPPGEVDLAPHTRIRERRQPEPEEIPAEDRSRLGRLTAEKTIPELIRFLEEGGTILAIGSSTNLAGHAGVPIGDHVVDGEGRPLPAEQYYVPASVLRVRVDNTHPLAYGLNEWVDVFFDNSPVFRPHAGADKKGFIAVAWFDSDRPLRSGWAWGQDRLFGGVAVAQAEVGRGRLFLYGPEVLFRGQSHGTFKLFFNGIYLGGASPVQMGSRATEDPGRQLVRRARSPRWFGQLGYK